MFQRHGLSRAQAERAAVRFAAAIEKDVYARLFYGSRHPRAVVPKGILRNPAAL